MTITVLDSTGATRTVKTIDDLAADGGQATLGTTTGAAVVTDATGTLQQYLRGLVKLIAAAVTGGAGSLFSKITDGTNTATIKAASTAALATDTALVVAISPNSSGSVAQGSTTSGQTGALIQGAVTTAAPTYTTAQTSPLSLDAAGNLRVGVVPGNTETAASGVTIGTSGVGYLGWFSSIAKLLSSALTVNLVPTTAGGLTSFSAIMAATTNANGGGALAGAHQVYKIEIINNSANIGYLKLYDSATAPTAGVGTPKKRLMVPGNASGVVLLDGFDNGLAFASGIAFTFTGGIADADTTAVAASAFIVNIDYK